MKEFCNPNILKIAPYTPGKPIEEVKRELGLTDVTKLASNESPYPVSANVLKAISMAAQHVNRYPQGDCFNLRDALAKRLSINPNQLVFGNGSDEVIVMAIRAFVNPGDEVIIAKPSFLVYSIASVLAGATIKEVPLTAEFKYDLNVMQQQVSDKTKIIFIGNPDNPAGTYVTSKHLEDFLKALPKNIIVFIDEAYFEYVDASDYPDSVDLISNFPNVVVSRTFSKMYGLAGLRVGYGFAQAETIDLLNRVREPFNVNSIAQAAAIAALEDERYYQIIAEDIKQQRHFLCQELDVLGVSYRASVSNFILINVKKDSKSLVDALMKKGVIVRGMSAWGLNQYIRVSIGLNEENQKFIKTLKEILALST